jgi:hypothetical protein
LISDPFQHKLLQSFVDAVRFFSLGAAARGQLWFDLPDAGHGPYGLGPV